MPRLTDTQIPVAEAWLHDLFAWGDLAAPRRKAGYDETYAYGPFQTGLGKDAAVAVCKFLLDHKGALPKEFEHCDSMLNILSTYKFCPKVDEPVYGWRTKYVTKDTSMLARYLAYFCDKINLKWDDTAASTYDRDAIRATSIGKALADYNLFVTQATQQKSTTTKARTINVNTNSSSTPQNSYKASGPQSANIPNLIGTPGHKITSLLTPNGYLCYITADKTGKNTPTAFITPLKADGTSVSQAKAESINFGSANGYTDCTIFFSDLQIASAAKDLCVSKFSKKFSNIRVVKTNKFDQNGYFAVSTEIGPAFIKANKLNEDLDANLENEEITENELATTDAIDRILKRNDKKIISNNSYQVECLEDFDAFEIACKAE